MVKQTKRMTPSSSMLSTLVLGIFLVSFGSGCRDLEEPGCYSKIVLDEIAQVVRDAQFDNDVWRRVVSCLELKSTEALPLVEVSDKAWKGFVEFGISGGSPTDIWGETVSPYIEKDPTLLSGSSLVADLENIIIIEPCNTVSNGALYRAVLAVCETDAWTLPDDTITAFVRSFNLLAFGSHFFHASNTKVGNKADVLGIDILSYVGHQGSLQPLPYNPILFDLRNTSRPLTGIQMAEEGTRILLEENITNWLDLLNEFDLPSLELTFGAIVVTALNLFLEEESASLVASLLAGLLLGEGSEFEDFLLNVYQPALIQAYTDKSISASLVTRVEMALRFTGTTIKLIYAFLWQEVVIQSDFVTDPTANVVGAALIPVINRLANSLTGYDRSSDPAFQASFDVYPGDEKCNRQVAHAKWHEVSANGLVDLFLLADDSAKIIRGERLDRRFNAGFERGLHEKGSETKVEDGESSSYFANLRRNLELNLQKGDCVDDYLVKEEENKADLYGFLLCLKTPLYGCATDCMEALDAHAEQARCALDCYLSLAGNDN